MSFFLSVNPSFQSVCRCIAHLEQVRNFETSVKFYMPAISRPFTINFLPQTCGTQLSKAKAEVGCEALSSSLDAQIRNNMLQEHEASSLQAEASPCLEEKGCDAIARGIQQTRHRTPSARRCSRRPNLQHSMHGWHAAQHANT